MKIKLKAWDDENKKMVRPILVENESGVTIDERGFQLIQFTGLYDVNGVEIYEGDIVVVPDIYLWFDNDGQPNYRGVVEWVFSQWQVIAYCVNPDRRGISSGINYGFNDSGVDEGEKSDWLIVGNIHQNPDL